jgi:NAD+ synthase (glutamine-hydrolysing)
MTDGGFWSVYSHGFARVAAVSIPVHAGDPAENAREIIAQARVMHNEGVALVVFPELCLSGYSLDDLFLSDVLQDAVVSAVDEVCEATMGLMPVLVVGAPLRVGNRLYNCGVAIHGGEILGVVPKTHLPNYREFYEKRWFAPGDRADIATVSLCGQEVPFGNDLIFTSMDVPDLRIHLEICEDMWVPIPPSAQAALAGATVLCNLSASPITVARAEDRRLMVRSAAARFNAAYIYAAASQGESSNDLSWDGQTMIYECGDLLGESERFPDGPRATIVDVDLDRIRQERTRQGSFEDNHANAGWPLPAFREVEFDLSPPQSSDTGLRRTVDRFPFVPDEVERLELDCYEAYNIQVSALVQRIRSIGTPKIVIGVSGGLDSTHALIVAAKVMDLLRRPRTDILAYTLPGFATGSTTKDRAWRLMRALGVTAEEIDIRPACTQMLADMGHPFGRGEKVYDVTFENVQAGLRTDYLFRLANHHGGIVLGTGDLSELALGWATYGVGDQMSHYAVNCGVPKTLIQHLIRWVIASGQFEAEAGGSTNTVLAEILDQEISPELVPDDGAGTLQSTQATIGPYPLQDFTLYWTLRYGLRPSKITFLQWHAWHDADAGAWPPGFPEADRVAYDLPAIRQWMELFFKRFFANQFKRTCIPNGPKVLPGGSLSPRGDWRMPSDASVAAWLADLKRVPDSR